MCCGVRIIGVCTIHRGAWNMVAVLDMLHSDLCRLAERGMYRGALAGLMTRIAVKV